jgi:hypothetical protein
VLRLCLLLALVATSALADEPSPRPSVLIVDGMNNRAVDHDILDFFARVLATVSESSS